MTILKKSDIDVLRMYMERSGNGRGRVTGASARLLKAGYVRLINTGFHDWQLQITNSGKQFLLENKP
jgi:hypothetical protein